MKTLKSLTLLIALTALLAVGVANANPPEAVITGENICLGCTLKTEQGAGAQCSIFGHRHSLRVTSAKVGGKDMPEMNGWVLHYLETKESKELIRDHHNETVTVVGVVYADERVLEVGSIKLGEHPTPAAEGKKEHPADHPDHPDHPD